MPKIGSVVLGSDEAATAVGQAIAVRGNAVDAVVAAVFAAAALHPSVLLGPVQLLIGGPGAGARAVDGRVRQPGRGHPRPRGFLPTERVPDAARVGIPVLPAALLAAAATYGKLTVAQLVAPALDLVRNKSKLRAAVLSRVAQRGATALSDAPIADELARVAGRLAGGLLSPTDLDEVRPVLSDPQVDAAPAGRELLSVPWGGAAVRDARATPLFGGDTRVVVAADRNGLLAVACYEVPKGGLMVEGFDLVAPFHASPVLRGERRVNPGEACAAPAPIALGRAGGVIDVAVGLGADSAPEASLREWLATYRPQSELERAEPTPAGLVGAQRAGKGWARI
jgi:Gamma-glutamyltranspeptidase